MSVVLLCFAAALQSLSARAQDYVGIAPPNPDDLFGTAHLSITDRDRNVIDAPMIENQVAFAGVRISDDHRRVGWLSLEPNCCTSYPVPKRLVIFHTGKIETVISEEQCIFEWTFVRHGTAVAYWISALHGTDIKRFFLRDIASRRLLAEYFMPSSETWEGGSEKQRSEAITQAPKWVKRVPRFSQ